MVVDFSRGKKKYNKDDYKMAVFAGGCFWCMEKPFKELGGVLDVISGYIGGKTLYPTYDEVCSGDTGHLEAIQVVYDPSKTSYSDLLDVFWRQVDPTDKDGQFVDRGSQYATAIFYYDEDQRILAEKSKEDLDKSRIYNDPIVTPIIRATEFYPAEEYHQNFYKTNPERYEQYRKYSGRDKYLDIIWKK